ncbi:MAG: hypothetical protein ACREPI_03260 [Candidatus Dormibacterales bacterium]
MQAERGARPAPARGDPLLTVWAWLGRIDARAEMAGAAVLGLLLLAVGADAYVEGVYSPAGAARAYLAALNRGDAGAAWAVSIVDGSRLEAADASLVTEADLRSALQVPGNRGLYPGAVTGAVRESGGNATVEVAYGSPSAVRHLTLRLTADPLGSRLGLFPTWRVVLEPSVLTLRAPAGAGEVSIDGRALGSGRPPGTVAVFPLLHRVRLAASPLFGAWSGEVDAHASATLSPAPALTGLGRAAARAALGRAWARCAASTDALPAGCPQWYAGTSAPPASVGWQLVGDPTAGATFGVDGQGRLVATGHYQTVVTFAGPAGEADRRPVGGGFRATLVGQGRGFSVASLGAATGLRPVPRPKVSDQIVEAAVREAFLACTEKTVLSPADCPQADVVAGLGTISGVRWRLLGDPLTGAQVTFDGARSVFVVTGAYAMSVDYDASGYVLAHYTDSSSGGYEADLFWDGAALVPVSIVGTA